jgi:broad specificity phosphatase PhoE
MFASQTCIAQYITRASHDLKLTSLHILHDLQALDEINAGRMDGLTYEFVAEHMADEYEARRLDKVCS